jgi:ferredoxin
MRIAEQFEAAPVRVAPERCLRRRHKEAPCRRCLEACPTQAITEGDQIALDAKRCVGCGLCVHLCPTETFRGSAGSAGKLLKVLGALSDGSVEFACDRKDSLGLTRAEVSHVVKVKACLGTLSLPTLLAAAAQGATNDRSGSAARLWLNDEPCLDCPIGSVQSEIRRTVEATNRLLVAYGWGPSVFTYSGWPELLAGESQERPVVQGDLPLYSRRDFFSSLRSQAQGALVSAMVEKLPVETGQDVEYKLAHRVPSGHRSLARILTRLGQPLPERLETAGLPFGAVSIRGDCTACGLCARLCPSGALSFVDDEEFFVINFNAVDCLDCTICSLICPADAVVFEPELDPRQLAANVPQILRAGKLAPCQKCGTPCATEHDEPLCYVCHQRQGQSWRVDWR